MLQKIKDWVLLVLLAIIGVLSAIMLARKPQWVKEKEKEVEDRKKAIKKAKKQEERAENYYKELMQKHDEEIEGAEELPDSPDFDDAADAADYLRDKLFGRRRR